jgi:hypothetical protein
MAGKTHLVTHEERWAFIRKAHAYSTDALEVIACIMKSENSEDSERLKAAGMILDRTFGKPSQQVQLTGMDDGPVQIESPRERLMSRLAEIKRNLEDSTQVQEEK